MFNFFGGNSKPARRNSVTDSTDSVGSASSGAQPKQFRPTDAVGVDRLLYGHDTRGKSAQWKDANHEPVKGGLTPAKIGGMQQAIGSSEAPIIPSPIIQPTEGKRIRPTDAVGVDHPRQGRPVEGLEPRACQGWHHPRQDRCFRPCRERDRAHGPWL